MESCPRTCTSTSELLSIVSHRIASHRIAAQQLKIIVLWFIALLANSPTHPLYYDILLQSPTQPLRETILLRWCRERHLGSLHSLLAGTNLESHENYQHVSRNEPIYGFVSVRPVCRCVALCVHCVHSNLLWLGWTVANSYLFLIYF